MTARLIRRLPVRLQPVCCLLFLGHYYSLVTSPARMFLRCEICAHESAGMEIDRPSTAQRVLPGEARRFESAARRLSA